MKIGFVVSLIPMLALHCSTLKDNTQHNRSNNPNQCSEIYSDWSLYSKGLYYKEIKDYKMAIHFFMDAAIFKVELDRIYYQLAECYSYLCDYDMAVHYSNQAIKMNKGYSKPYMLLYKIYMNLNDYEEAAAILEDLIDVKPELINIHYSLGLLYFNQLNEYDRAIIYFRNILELSNAIPIEDFYNDSANYYIGRIYYKKNLIERSIEHFKRAIEINPDNNNAFYYLARILMDIYSFDEAKKYISCYLMRFPENIMMNADMGRIYYIENNPKARGCLRRGMSSKYIYGQLAKALYYELLEKDDEAERDLRSIINMNPILISPHIALARINLRKNDKKAALSEYFSAGILMYKERLYDEARHIFIKVLSIDDKRPDVYFYLGKIYEETGCPTLAMINFKKSNKLRPSIQVQVHIGYLYSRKDNFRESTRYFDMAIELEPTNPKPYFFKGLAFSFKKDYPQAEEYMKRAIGLQQDNDTYHFYLATVLEKQSRVEEAIQSLKMAIQYNPQNDMACNYLGYLYADLNINIDESIDLIQKALKVSPYNGSYLDSLGWAYYRKGKLRLAIKKLLQAEQQLEKDKTPDPVVFDHIGDAYHKIGNNKKAIEYWQKSLKLRRDQKIEKKVEESSQY